MSTTNQESQSTLTIERLRESKKQGQRQAYEDGVSAGRFWAERDATHENLERLRRFQNSDDWRYRLQDNETEIHRPMERLGFIAIGDEDRSRLDEIFSEDVDSVYEGEWAVGFAEGAMEAYGEHRSQL